jgi:peptide/nickel transport system permease protein
MAAYTLRRLVQMIPLTLGITIVLFAVIQAAPGDAADFWIAQNQTVSPEVADRYRVRLGLDQPAYVQYVRWLGSALRGDLGVSFSTTRPVTSMILERLPATLELMGASFLLAAVLAFALGTFSAVKPYSWFDNAGTGLSFLGIAMPVFWFALILQLIFGVWLQWLPISGTRTVGASSLGDHLLHLILPVVVLSFRFVAGWSRYLRSSLMSVLREDYIRTARAKGLSELRVVGVHAMRNALIPVVSVMALNLATLFSGAVITETVFAWPGIGRMFVTAMLSRDYPLLMGILMMGSIMVLVFNLVADLVYGWLDPRIRYE